MPEQAPHLFCFGLGYCAEHLAQTLQQAAAGGWHISGTTRSADKAAQLQNLGIRPVIWEAGRAMDSASLEGVTHMLHSVPPGEKGDPVLAALREHGAMPTGLQWFGYLSTTGVYGNTDGAWVDEDAPLLAEGVRQQRRVDAEREWLQLWQAQALPVHIFRLAGIYGPGRNSLRSLREGTARRIHKPGQFFSRIHVQDIVQVLQASMAQPEPGCIYNVCDDLPAPAEEVVAYAAQLLGVEPPPQEPYETASLSAMQRSFYGSSRRVKNERIRHGLGVELRYPDYKAGLQALLEAGESAQPLQ